MTRVCGGWTPEGGLILDGCYYNLNPIFWLLTPFVSGGDFSVSAGGGTPHSIPQETDVLLLAFLYWIIVSYIFTSIILSFKNKIPK